MQSLLIVLNILYESVDEIYVEQDIASISFSDGISGPVLEIVNHTRHLAGPKSWRTKEPSSLKAERFKHVQLCRIEKLNWVDKQYSQFQYM